MPTPTRTEIYPIYSPSKGLVLNAQSPFLNPQASPDCQNVRYYDQIVEKRTGYPSAAYASGTITGVPLKLYTYTKEDGTDYEILATTTNIYYRTTGAWTSIVDTLSMTVTSRISLSTMYKSGNYYLIIASKELGAKQWNGTTYATIAETTNYSPKIMIPYQFRLLMFNYDNDGTDYPIGWRYCAALDYEDWDGTGSGARSLIQGAGSKIMNAVSIKDYVGIYKDKSITILDYVGGSSIFATAVHIEKIGLLAQDAIINLGTSHLFIGSDYNIYEWNGGWELIPIGNPVKKYIKDNIYKTNKLRCFAVPNYERTEAHFFIPIGTDDYPTRFLTYNWTDKTWALNTCVSCSGAGNLDVSGVEKTMLGLSAGTVHNYDYSSLNDGSTAINSYFATPDVTVSKEEYKILRKDFKNLYIDAKGNYLGMQYSSDEGATYSDVDTDELESTTTYNLHDFNFTDAKRNIRFKFSNSTIDQTYAVRFVGIEHKDIKQSGRK